MGTEEEHILAAIYINLINMINALTGHLPNFKYTYVFHRKLLQVKKIQNILLFQTALLANDKYEVAKRKPVVGYNSRKG